MKRFMNFIIGTIQSLPMKLLISAFQSFLYFLGVIFLFVPNMFVRKHYEYSYYYYYGNYHKAWSLKDSTPISFYRATLSFDIKIGWFIIALMVLLLALFALNTLFYYTRIRSLSIFTKKPLVIVSALPIALFILFATKIRNAVYYGYNYNYDFKFEADPNPLFYFEMIILVVVFLLDVFKAVLPVRDE